MGMSHGRDRSQIGESQRLNIFAGNLAAAFPRHLSPVVGELRFIHRVNQITFSPLFSDRLRSNRAPVSVAWAL
jgi:hypothetical protein